MGNIRIICARELAGYFGTPIAYVFLAIFVFLSGIFAFYIGNFLEGGQANLQSFFVFHPWLYLFLIPALSMRLWAEERRAGTIELLFTLPVTMVQAVIGKFLAAWVFTAIALILTFPLWITVNYLGDPGQRRRPRRLPRQPADGRRVPRHRLVHLRPDPQPGHRLRGERRGVPGLRAERLSAGARIRRRALPGDRGGRGALLQLPHPLPGHQQGRAPGRATSSTSSPSSCSGCSSTRW